MKVRCITFSSHGDDRGQLIALEQEKEIPFDIKRIYYIYGTTSGVRRGFHAHKELKQVLVCVSGSCKLHFDDGKETTEILMDSPCKGVLVTGVVWREMYDFTKDAVLVVLASEFYNEEDYIRDYDTFLNYIKENNFYD